MPAPMRVHSGTADRQALTASQSAFALWAARLWQRWRSAPASLSTVPPPGRRPLVSSRAVCGNRVRHTHRCLRTLRSRRSRSPPGGCKQARPPAKREHATHRCCRLPDTRRGESKAQSRRRHVCCQSLPLEHCRTPAQEDRLKRELTNMERDTGIKLRVLAQNYPETPGLAVKDFWSVRRWLAVLAGLQHLCPFCLRAIRSATRVAQVPDSAHM